MPDAASVANNCTYMRYPVTVQHKTAVRRKRMLEESHHVSNHLVDVVGLHLGLKPASFKVYDVDETRDYPKEARSWRHDGVHQARALTGGAIRLIFARVRVARPIA